MKQAIISIVIIAISIVIWLHWGGLSNDMGTLIIALADVFFITVILDNCKKAPAEK